MFDFVRQHTKLFMVVLFVLGFPAFALWGIGSYSRMGSSTKVAVVDGKSYPSVTDIGMKPTVDYGGVPLAETYIHGFSGDLYGSPLTVELCDFIRPEKKFGSLDELKEQINADIASAINIL